MDLQQLWATIAPYLATYLPILVLGVITAGTTFYGPQIVARYPRLGILVALARRVGLDLSAPQTGRDQYERYAAAKGFLSATGTTLPPWDELPARERAAWDASVEALRALRPASDRPPPPSSLPPGAGLLLLFILAAPVLLSGCGNAREAQLRVASDVANAGAEAGNAAAPIIEEVCVQPMGRALAVRDVDGARAIAARCDAPIAALDLLRYVHIELRSAIVAIASGRVPDVDVVALIGQTVDATQALGSALARLR